MASEVMDLVRDLRRDRARHRRENPSPDQMLRIVVRARLTRLRFCWRWLEAREQLRDFAIRWLA
jgi:hypothetical protein